MFVVLTILKSRAQYDLCEKNGELQNFFGRFVVTSLQNDP